MSGLLKSIRNPRDLRQVPIARLPHLAEELRQRILDRFAMKDAYLKSALGMADLTTALHYVFDFAHDKLIFDLAHQAAAHLVLTRGESSDGADVAERPVPVSPGDEREPYDHFFALHPGTSISKALGIAQGSDGSFKTVAVIGDGAVVSGIALEALNNGHGLNSNTLVILNDNEMSVSKVVGAMGEYLSKIRAGKTYNELKKDAHKILQSIPIIGTGLDKAAEQLKDAVAKALVPGSIFEKLGPRYFGPVDGHNVGHLVQLMNEIKDQKGFNLLHVITRRDESVAGNHERLVFPVSSKKLEDGQDDDLNRGIEFERQGEDRWNDVFASSLLKAAKRDPKVRLLLLAAPDVRGIGHASSHFENELPGRVFDMQLNEQHGVAFAAGLAHSGLKPVIVAPASVLQRAQDQIFQEVALSGLPVVLALCYSGLIDAKAGLYHGTQDIASLRVLPGIDIMAPRDGRELDAMLDMALQLNGPSALRISHSFAPDPDRLYAEQQEFVRARPEILRRGSDIAIFALGSLVYPAMEAAELMAQKGLESTVINARFARPLDPDFLESMLDEHTILFTLEEHGVAGGFGSAVLELAAMERLGADKIVPIGVPEGPISRASRSRLLRRMGLDRQGLADRMVHAYRHHVRSSKR